MGVLATPLPPPPPVTFVRSRTRRFCRMCVVRACGLRVHASSTQAQPHGRTTTRSRGSDIARAVGRSVLAARGTHVHGGRDWTCLPHPAPVVAICVVLSGCNCCTMCPVMCTVCHGCSAWLFSARTFFIVRSSAEYPICMACCTPQAFAGTLYVEVFCCYHSVQLISSTWLKSSYYPLRSNFMSNFDHRPGRSQLHVGT